MRTQQVTNQLDRQRKARIVDRIAEDVGNGMYSQFPKLRDRLLYIMKKLRTNIYVVNSTSLTEGEWDTLRENNYL